MMLGKGGRASTNMSKIWREKGKLESKVTAEVNFHLLPFSDHWLYKEGKSVTLLPGQIDSSQLSPWRRESQTYWWCYLKLGVSEIFPQ